MRRVRREEDGGPDSRIPHFLCHLENNTPIPVVVLHSIIVCAHHMQECYNALHPHKSPAHRTLLAIFVFLKYVSRGEKKSCFSFCSCIFFLSVSLSFSQLSLHPSIRPLPSPPLLPPPCPSSLSPAATSALQQGFRSGFLTMSKTRVFKRILHRWRVHNGERETGKMMGGLVSGEEEGRGEGRG